MLFHTMAKPQATPVRAVQRTFDLLAQLSAEHPPATLSEFARGCELPVSTVARLLATLEQAGFLERDHAGRYGPGIRLAQIGLAALSRFNIYDLAEKYLQQLAKLSRETANLAVRADERTAVYLRQAFSPRAIRHVSWSGRILPLSRTAVGAALLGKAGASGYVASRDTFEADVTAVAAAVYGPGGQIVAAFSITGPSYRIDDAQLRKFGTLVTAQAKLASAELGAASHFSPLAARSPQ
jgi:IclR family acetate operon transcriptional repressor